MTAEQIVAAKRAELLKIIEDARPTTDHPEALACLDALKQWAEEHAAFVAAKQAEKK